MQFMVVEKFRGQDARSVYQRLRDRGRMMPDGLKFVSSWVAADLSRCFQLMEADDPTAFQGWIAQWADLVEFEVVPVSAGRETAAAVAPLLDAPNG